MIRNRLSGSPKPPELKLEGQQQCAGTFCGSPCQHILLEAGLSRMSAKREVQLEALSRFLPALLVCNLMQHFNFTGRKCKTQHYHVRHPVTELACTFPHSCCCLVLSRAWLFETLRTVACTAGGLLTTEPPGKPTFCHTCLQNLLQRKLQLHSQASRFCFHPSAHLDLVNNKFCDTGVWNKYPLFFIFYFFKSTDCWGKVKHPKGKRLFNSIYTDYLWTQDTF